MDEDCNGCLFLHSEDSEYDGHGRGFKRGGVHRYEGGAILLYSVAKSVTWDNAVSLTAVTIVVPPVASMACYGWCWDSMRCFIPWCSAFTKPTCKIGCMIGKTSFKSREVASYSE